MYNEEKVINGVLHYRKTPDGKFAMCTPEAITERYEQLKREHNRLSGQCRLFENRLMAINRAATDFTINYDNNGEIEKE